MDTIRLLNAYYQGIFPMALDNGEIYWFDPDPRAIIPLDAFHVPKRLARTISRGGFEVQFDYDFRAVISACAEVRPARERTWISPEIIDSYIQLHHLGFAHSVEIWIDRQLQGGLYGVSLQGLFAGESMFSRTKDASKIALVYLVQHLQRQGFKLLDTQFITPHLERFGAIEIRRAEYKRRLAEALRVDTRF